MSKAKTRGQSELNTDEPHADDDTAAATPNEGLTHEPDTDEDDDDTFDFGALLPEGVEFVELAPDFVRPEGFLMVPRLNKKTGEVFPFNATFVGILHDVVPWIDNRGKERVWFACEATTDLPGTNYTGKDDSDKEFEKPVLKGNRIGISGSGAINALKAKKGHFVALHWTGRKVTVKNGDMWEVKARVSAKPVIAPEVKKA
jgi:hypothetical protein